MPHDMGIIAQLIRAHDYISHDVEGSSPSDPTIAYISTGLEMINRPMHYLFRKIMHLMKKRSSTLGEIN